MDIVDVADVADSVARFGARYLERVYTTRELATCDGGADHRRLAAHFAVKEATLKTLGADDPGVDWRSVEADAPTSGHVSVRLSGAVAELARSAGIVTFAVSVGATRRHATAVVVAERSAESGEGGLGSE